MPHVPAVFTWNIARTATIKDRKTVTLKTPKRLIHNRLTSDYLVVRSNSLRSECGIERLHRYQEQSMTIQVLLLVSILSRVGWLQLFNLFLNEDFFYWYNNRYPDLPRVCGTNFLLHIGYWNISLVLFKHIIDSYWYHYNRVSSDISVR